MPEKFFASESACLSLISLVTVSGLFFLSMQGFPIYTMSSSFVFLSLADINAILFCCGFIKGS